jgi:Zinc dependent phospholipase C
MRKPLGGLLIVLLFVPSTVGAWGFETHKFIVSRAIDLLPDAIRPFYEANRTFIVEHAIDPDLWRTAGFTDEPPRHFLDMDAYGRYPFKDLPHEYDVALEKYGADALNRNGLLPWRAAEMAGNLRRAFEGQQKLTIYARENIKLFSAIIGHYAADANVPFHAVLNYDGQLTGQIGIHARFEEELFLRYGKQLSTKPGSIRDVPQVREFIFETLLDSYSAVDAVLAADKKAIGDRTVYDGRYYDAFFADVKPILEKRLSDAIAAVASIIVTEWEAAGRPALPAVAPTRPPALRR